MKICAIICEYNPFHNGHLHQIQVIQEHLAPDAILCIMSGNFVQRGNSAVMDKFTRAKHALLSGADAVIELPAVFATSPAELFAKGAISILKEIPEVTTLCFGAENADKEIFLQAANLLLNEPKEVSTKIKKLISEGISYAKARAQAFEGRIPSPLLTSPNNVLGLEYTKAILSFNANIDIFPIPRVGGGYLDETLQETFSSATAIRKAIANGENIDNALPKYVEKDLPKQIENRLELLEKHAVLSKTKEDLSTVCDCGEGLENAFKKAATSKYSFAETLTSQRYTSSRIRRIALQNLLGISEKFIKECLTAPLYFRMLAVKKNSPILSLLSQRKLPLLVRAHDEEVLENTAKKCYEIDKYAEQIYALLYDEPLNKPVILDE